MFRIKPPSLLSNLILQNRLHCLLTANSPPFSRKDCRLCQIGALQCFIGVIDTVCQSCLTLARWDASFRANVAPSGRNSKLLSHPWLRRPPGASPGVMHGPALRAELGRSDDASQVPRWRRCDSLPGRMWLIRRLALSDSARKPPSFNGYISVP